MTNANVTMTKLLDAIDSLWIRFDGEGWLEDLIEQEQAGRVLRRIALTELGGGDASEMVAALRRGENLAS